MINILQGNETITFLGDLSWQKSFAPLLEKNLWHWQGFAGTGPQLKLTSRWNKGISSCELDNPWVVLSESVPKDTETLCSAAFVLIRASMIFCGGSSLSLAKIYCL